ncbi:carbohydrate porin [Gluconacetobacter sp. 1b LMG 1731]|uniref:Carbohydrate porin n=2 Tax=Gluconacetobacter dulcium TaxID=2729096 RepID=A0A7W4NVY5_9PROT|nr:carbohydrate porin [Gluconacetobacter dulcium]MBB2165838.1 carbohydrate porin [Gluconacetobacter dulcium]MBB2195036.1 carbohydrate porin [Gluconacetobacter dulcium]
MTVRLPPSVLCRMAGVLAMICPLTAGGGVLAATTPQVTDILPSGVPLPPPTPMEVQPPEDTGSELLGEAAGARPWLARHGIRINMQDVEELWGLAAGGLHPGPTYDGMTAMTVMFDTQRGFGWPNGLLNVSALQIRGRSLTSERLGAVNAVSGYDVGRSTRLFELWYGQGFFANRLDVRVGSIDLDTEFLVSQNASFFLNSSFGWPLSTSSNLYSGGPSWPFSALGVRAKWAPIAPLVLMGAVTDDNPTRGPFYSNEAPTQRDPSGTAFSTSGGTLFIGEAQFSADLALWIAGKGAPSLPGTWKLGGLYDTGRFPDQRYDSHGGLLASPDSTGQPLYHHDNWMMYVVADQMIWRAVPGSSKTISLFMRATANDGLRNRYSTEIQGGLTLDGLVPGRTDDTIGLAWGTGFYGSRAIGNAHDAVRLGTSLAGALKPEQHIEATYQAAVTPYLIVQPDFQYFWHVGGTSFNPETGRSIDNGVVLGVNMTTTF